jgi:hypothetical protein
MKRHKIELDTDFIGGQGPLTKAEEKIISDFISANRNRRKKLFPLKRKTTKKSKDGLIF